MTEASVPASGAAPKVDPESLVLRGSPARATRFRRGAIVAIAGAGATVVAGAAWLALKPVSIGRVGFEEDRGTVAAKAPSDTFAGAPASYGDVPPLGPKLPGDLGRPIIQKQREMGMAMPYDPQAEAAARAVQDVETERQRVAAEERAARQSGVMLQTAQAVSAPTGSVEAKAVPPLSQDEMVGGADVGGQRRKNDLVGRLSEGDHVSPHRLTARVSPWTLQAGSVIAASLITGLNSDLPGIVTPDWRAARSSAATRWRSVSTSCTARAAASAWGS